MNEDYGTGMIEKMLQMKSERIELFVQEFIHRIKPPIPFPVTNEKLKRRDIAFAIQGNKMWITTHGSRASKVLDVSLNFSVIGDPE